MTKDDETLLEARIARRLTANWGAIRRAEVTPLDVARDIIAALRETGSLPPLPTAKEPER